MIKVSVIVPVYKVPLEYLRGCLESLAAQTLQECEFLIVSDGAPEAECSICDKYTTKADYSAAYNEFILLDRPIAITLDDYNEYAKYVGFYVNFPEYAKGFNVYNFNDLKRFISEIAQGIDSKKQERQISLHKIHKYTDNQSTKRVVDFLIENVKL